MAAENYRTVVQLRESVRQHTVARRFLTRPLLLDDSGVVYLVPINLAMNIIMGDWCGQLIGSVPKIGSVLP